MEMIQTPQSSNIASFGYDETGSTLIISFKSGGTYSYSGVPLSIFEQMQLASSKGTFFANNIKGRYPYSKI